MIPNLVDLREYLGDNSVTDEAIEAALLVETMAQQDICRTPIDPADFPEPLAEALRRRVAVNLAKRGLPLMVSQGDSEFGPVFIPRLDSEVRRLEAPYRKLTVG